MAALTTDYPAVLSFIDRTKREECALDRPSLPAPLADEQNLTGIIAYLDLGLTAGHSAAEVAVQQAIQVFATGWQALEGVMLLQPEPEFDADLRVSLAARNERALYDLLHAFPPGKTGFFYVAGEWILKTLAALFDGQVLPAREGYYAAPSTFLPQSHYPARRLNTQDYALVQSQWSRGVWQELLDANYAIHACYDHNALNALLFHWQVAHWRNEVHGLQAVKDYAGSYAESAITSATQEVLVSGKIATCTANLASNEPYLRAFRNVGYRPFYRIHSFLGLKRGSGAFVKCAIPAFYHGGNKPGPHAKKVETPGKGGQIHKSKDPLLAPFLDLAHTAGRRERSQFLIEGVTLVQRALHDGLMVDSLLYTHDLVRAPEGVLLLNLARLAGVAHYLVAEGLMAKVTTTRPVPTALTAVYTPFRSADDFKITRATRLLVAENIQNPDNLGMVLRTADAVGVDGVVVAGERSDPFHKHCIRAARGTVGRLPIFSCRNLPEYLQALSHAGVHIVGAALQAERELFGCVLQPPITAIVGNEQAGISPEVLQACSHHVRIPMAPGQDSLNVGVAAGVLLYEILRQDRRATP